MTTPPPPPPPPPPPVAPGATTDATTTNTSNKNEETKKAQEEFTKLKETLVAAASTLEKGRCLEMEVEASLLVSSSLLRYAPGTSIEGISELPGGVKDACRVLEIHNHQESSPSTTVENSTATMETTTNLMFLDDNNINHHDDDQVQLPSGSIGKAVHTVALSTCLTRAATACQSIVKQRESSEQLLKDAMATMPAQTDSGALLRVMDERLRDIREYHARNDTTIQQQPAQKRLRRGGQPLADGYDIASLLLEETSQSKLDTLFAPEEIMGKYLDLVNVYESHVELLKLFMVGGKDSQDEKQRQQVPYIDFLSLLTNKGLASLKEQDKLNHRKKYARFLTDLLAYLKGFLQRTSPLLKVEDAIVKPAEQEFKETWRTHGGCNGYQYIKVEASLAIEDGDDDKNGGGSGDNSVDLSPFNTPEELCENVDAGILKTELSRLGLKCGGTPLDRAKRLFQTKDTPLDKLPKKLFAKGGKGAPSKAQQSAGTSTTNASSSGRRFDLAKTEAIVTTLLDQLRPNLEGTLRRAERRTTQTSKERMQEVEEELYGTMEQEKAKGEKKEDGEEGDEGDSDDSDDEEPIYNPKGVPLGWDGKPIPYWLFKLHGLNHFYPCEICGNESYRGRRNFEKHFAEAKHAYGMKCLGIPNTQHFHGVTKIEDAQQLWKTLESKMNEDKFDDRKEEEYEDSHGNVLSRATYEDLARQGLL